KNPDFVLNNAKWQGAQILLARDNFGCGSSREHAVWALAEYGFRAVIAPSFSPIFFGNAVQNGFLAAAVGKDAIDALFDNAADDNPAKITMDLQRQIAQCGDMEHPFDINAEDKRRLLEGLDAIGETLRRAGDIRKYEQWRRDLEPWVFDIPADK
ncbi:MAG: 3-isopropylmalate dehydratase small subunit, partial [Gammaproteobacteria bacterium]